MCLVAAALVQLSATPAAHSEPKSFDLPAESAEKSLKKFSAQSGLEILFATEMTAGVRTNAVKGTFPPHEAIDLMLAGTGLVATSTGALVIARQDGTQPNGPMAAHPAPAHAASDFQAPTEQPQKNPKTMKQKNPVTWLGSLRQIMSVAVTSLAFTASGPAQTPPNNDIVQLDPFTVTTDKDYGYKAVNSVSATLINAPIQNLPMNITVLTDDVFKDAGLFKVEDAVRFVSGVGNVGRNEVSGFGEVYQMRGFQTSVQVRNGLASVNSLTDSSNIDRIEVVKGPGTLLYGSPDAGGIVNIITRQPARKRIFNVRATAGSFDFYRAQWDLNLPVGTDRVLFRFMGSQQSNNTFREFEKQNATFLNPVLLLDLTKRTRLVLDYQLQKSDGRLQRIQEPFLINPSKPAEFTGFVPIKRGDSMVSPNDIFDVTRDSKQFRLSHRFGDNTSLRVVGSQASYDTFWYQRINGAVRPTLDASDKIIGYPKGGSLFADYTKGGSTAYDVNLVSSGYRLLGTTHTLLLGYRYATGSSGRSLYFGNAAGAAALRAGIPAGWTLDWLNRHPDPTVQNFLPALTDNGTRYFGTDIRSLRPNEDPERSLSRGYYGVDQIQAFDGRVEVLLGARHVNVAGRKFIPQAGLNYRIMPGIRAYAAYMETVRDNGLTFLAKTPLPPEKAVSQEIGLKFDLIEGKLWGAVSLFSLAREDILVADGFLFGLNPIPREPRTTAGEHKNEGFEMDLVLTPIPQLQVILAYAHYDARVSKVLISSDPNFDLSKTTLGFPLEGVSDNSVRSLARYSFERGPLKRLTIGGSIEWSEGPIALFNPIVGREKVQQKDDIFRLDAFARYQARLFDRNVSFQLNVINLSDEDYYDRRAARARPRTSQFTMGVDF